ncbi:MAG: EAL domain-containing protein, partial [Gammaproteobacteria bacterium]|nr:EAL domain-containing protein [Gammaproteobacteria bacterium]
DQFKIINDTCGHIAGDELLSQLAIVLQQQVRKRDTLARLGGDEFGILMEYCTPDQAMRIAENLRQSIERFRFIWEQKSFRIGVSIGLVPITGPSRGMVDILRAADTACYTAKDAGRNQISVYSEDDAGVVRRHGEMWRLTQVQRALEENRFQLNYQPIVPIGDGNDEGFYYELLVRMTDDSGNVIMPTAFLPAVEHYNLSAKLDRWVIDNALGWLSQQPGHVELLDLCSINLSANSLEDNSFRSFVFKRLQQSKVPAEKICFEITETAAIANLVSTTDYIESLKELGCRFALDDFGSGLSSFAYLKNLPVDFLKIDGQFVKNILVDSIDLEMVKSANQIGHAMGKQTIAEFVENEAVFGKLQEIGVDYAQGFITGKPRPLDDIYNVFETDDQQPTPSVRL